MVSNGEQWFCYNDRDEKLRRTGSLRTRLATFVGCFCACHSYCYRCPSFPIKWLIFFKNIFFCLRVRLFTNRFSGSSDSSAGRFRSFFIMMSLSSDGSMMPRFSFRPSSFIARISSTFFSFFFTCSSPSCGSSPIIRLSWLYIGHSRSVLMWPHLWHFKHFTFRTWMPNGWSRISVLLFTKPSRGATRCHSNLNSCSSVSAFSLFNPLGAARRRTDG